LNLNLILLMSNFCCILNVCFLLGDSMASGVYMAAFRNTYPPMKMEQKKYSETLAYKLQTPVNRLEKKSYNTLNMF
jgi:hypothetical protein